MYKKPFFIIIFFFLFIPTLDSLVFAQDSFRIPKNQQGEIEIDRHDECRIVINNRTDYDIFVPVKTKSEWDNFRIHHPGHVVLEDCVIPFSCGDNFLDERDGQAYKTVQIGDQCWFAENINVGTMVFGGTSQGSYCNEIKKYCYNNILDNCNTYGGLYKGWMVFCVGSQEQGICPDGWHVAINDEWATLINYVGTSENAGTKLKVESPDWDGDDDFGFSALPGGYWVISYSGDAFYGLGFYGYWWSSSAGGGSFFRRRMISGYSGVYRTHASGGSYGYSVRCIRD